MGPIRLLSRVALSAIFIDGGIDVYRDPEPRAAIAGPFVEKLAAVVQLPTEDPVAIVRANAVVQVAAGAALATGVLPRLSALVLAGSLVPTTVGAHAFWEVEDPARRRQQKTQFLKNAGILSGLLLIAAG